MKLVLSEILMPIVAVIGITIIPHMVAALGLPVSGHAIIPMQTHAERSPMPAFTLSLN